MRKPAEGESDQLNKGANPTGPREASLATGRRRTRKPQTGIVLGCGKTDRALLSSAIRDWIVPVLVREFLAEHSGAAHATEANSNRPTTGVLGEEGAGSTRMNPNGH